ncbi:dephospho-CoA kinase [Alkalicoccus halolimnae]|uniref:Dephospho-CoA kinase n=1 Tax=Alkalicoccus halolimnae TaxID=1667239 RepID=A0A5C7F8P6_9BACI|nr:dephospho-CoA kinase [Alkalicoccus halolimnae]TXF85748.1 dephospho-CoA kinase [Alkalicoccus halolimnae]
MKLGLTGSIATGKSTVTGMFRDRGYPVIDADIISREVVEPGKPALEEIVEYFGKSVLYEDGTLNRKKLGDIVFEHPEEREKLNSIVHPAVRLEMKSRAEEAEREGEKLIVLDIPLLIENDLYYLIDEVLVVYVPEEVQKQRLMERNGYSEEEASRRISSQLSIEKKRKEADFLIDNSGTLDDTERQVEELIEKLTNS